MVNKIKTNNNLKSVSYAVKTGRRVRRLSLAVYCDGRLVVSAPWFVGANVIDRFVKAKIGWITNKINYFKSHPKLLSRINNKNEFAKYKSQALLLACEKVKYYNQFYNFSINNINIKNQKTRWGSCSKKGNLNFNYKIALLPNDLADYLVVHELCHLGEFNHSAKFWKLVAKTIPNYLELRKQLKKY